MSGGFVFAAAGSDQQPVTSHKFVKHTGFTVIPGGDTLGGVSSQNERDVSFIAEVVPRFRSDFGVEPPIGNRSRKSLVLSGENLQHPAAIIETSAFEVLMGKGSRQNPDDFIRLAERHAGYAHVRDRGGIPGTRKQYDPCRIPGCAMKKLQCQDTFVIHLVGMR